MRQSLATFCGLMLLLLGSSANAADVDIMVTEMEDLRGEKTVHTQNMSGEKCDAFLSKLRELRAKKTRPIQLTLLNPTFSGYVVDALASARMARFVVHEDCSPDDPDDQDDDNRRISVRRSGDGCRGVEQLCSRSGSSGVFGHVGLPTKETR